jgi:hypothetical protein
MMLLMQAVMERTPDRTTTSPSSSIWSRSERKGLGMRVQLPTQHAGKQAGALAPYLRRPITNEPEPTKAGTRCAVLAGDAVDATGCSGTEGGGGEVDGTGCASAGDGSVGVGVGVGAVTELA